MASPKGILSGKSGWKQGINGGKSKAVTGPLGNATGGAKMRGVKSGIAKSTTAPSRAGKAK